MSFMNFAKKAARSYAASQSHSAHHRPGRYRPGYGQRVSPKATAAHSAVREGRKLLRRL
ncbi:hypothetical protein [Histidinibacterium aquaticum]|uniref:hypothetical protein n=1 Tax=Histidinibacterium aquaticum TaxID=2613962 RepID=UPI00168B6F26|nr:hypothetical protein [Histidinibacterium aquaticum]